MKFPEPVALAAAIRVSILAAVAFGLRWTPEQIAALMLAVEAILGLITRAQVTPTGAPQLQLGQSVNNGAATVTSVTTEPSTVVDAPTPEPPK